jgi:hypothetical protein
VALVVPTNEELVIASETLKTIKDVHQVGNN